MKTLSFAVAALVLAASTAFAEVHVTMQNGRVTVVAKDATIRQILTEWARVGQTKIVNIERIPGGPITLELTNVTEGQALEVLLRTLSGYITAPRAVDAASLSQFDRIIIMPTLAAARPTVASAPPPPVFQQTPQFTQQLPAADDEPDDQRPTPAAVPPANRGPVFNAFPQPQVVNPQPSAPVAFPGAVPAAATPPPQQAVQPANAAAPTSPYGGVAVPGMIVPAPPQPGQAQPGQVQPGTVQQPGAIQPSGIQPLRRPGGQ
jgi:hypothetical protein